MKAHEIAEMLLKGPNLEVDICCGSWECDPTIDPVELIDYEHKNWKYDRETGKYIELPSDTRLRFTERYDKPIKGEVIRDNKCIEL